VSSIDAVLSHRVNPFTSGVARFNHILAGELGVPVVPIFSTSLADFRQPLISIKVSEMDAETRFRAAAALRAAQPGARVFLHDWVGSKLELSMVRRAAWVHCGNAAIEEAVRPHNPCCDTLWSPGSISDRRFIGLPEVAVLTFGMAHKIRAGEFSRLRTLLEETGRCFALYVSTANHESVGLEDGQAVHDEMRELFGPEHLFFLGTLSDVAISNALRRATFFAAFFAGGVRANNSSVVAALEHGAVVITNLDRHSPPWLVHGENVLDIRRCESLPLERARLDQIGAAALSTIRDLSWSALADALATAPTRAPMPADGSATLARRPTGRAAETGSGLP
jgi:hypothetical protein